MRGCIKNQTRRSFHLNSQAASAGARREVRVSRPNSPAGYCRVGRMEAGGSYRNFFPSVHLRYEPFRGLITRASWSNGIGRPPFDTIIPNNSVNDDAARVSVTNPNLRPQYSNNYDLSVEYYFPKQGWSRSAHSARRSRTILRPTAARLFRPGRTTASMVNVKAIRWSPSGTPGLRRSTASNSAISSS
jgi:outer membrane receptor protein involved in Fe transport